MKKLLGLGMCAWVFCVSGVAEPAQHTVYGSWGFDVAAMDTAVRPGDNFFRYVNGSWLDRVSIPPDKTAITHRLEMTDRIEARLHAILELDASRAAHRPTDLDGKVGAFYKAFMNAAAVEQLAAKPIESSLNAVRVCPTRAALATLTGRANADFVPALFNLSIDVDLKDPTRYAVYVSQGGLGMPDRDYYLQSAFAAQKAAYQAYVGHLLELSGWQAARSKDVVEFETRIAAASWSKAEQRDPVATYNAVSRAELTTLAPGLPWPRMLAAAGVTTQHLVVAEKSAFPKIAAEFARTPLPTLQAWAAFHIADSAAPYLSAAFTNASFEFHDKLLAGQDQERPRWQRGITAVSGGDFGTDTRFGTFGTMGFAVGQVYTARYFPPAAKAQVEALVEHLLASYRARLEQLDWMSTATKAEALKKLNTYTVKIGYPDVVRDYTALVTRDDDLLGNVQRAAAFDWHFVLTRSLGAVDKGEWLMTPQTNDAYNGSLRDIVFPAGILQPPMFDPQGDPAINYGAIGGVIGHELTHGFDDQGRAIDAAGALRDWWAPDDAAQFRKRAALLGAQYSAFRPLAADPGVHVNGDLTMGENIADLGGLTLAVDAYVASLGGHPAPVIDGYTGVQRVFLGWAQAWGGKVTDDYVRKQVVSDPHSPRQFRVNGVVHNIDAWYAAFDVKPADALYVAPEARVRIW